jgi:hypothetical protein
MAAAAAAAVAARAILDNVDTDHAHSAALADVSTALSDMDRAVRAFDPTRPMRIYGKVSMYKDANQRASHWALWRDRNPDQAAKASPAEWDEEMKAYGILGDAVHRAAQRNSFFHLGTMPNMVFRHSFLTKLYADESEEARADHQRRDTAWHEFAVLLRNRCVSGPPPSPLIIYRGLKRDKCLILSYMSLGLHLRPLLRRGRPAPRPYEPHWQSKTPPESDDYDWIKG